MDHNAIWHQVLRQVRKHIVCLSNWILSHGITRIRMESQQDAVHCLMELRRDLSFLFIPRTELRLT